MYNTELFTAHQILNFRKKNFCRVDIVTKITKIFYYENLELYGISMLRKSLSYHPSIIQSFEFNVEEVCNELESLNPSKACGPDLIPARLLKLGA